MLLVLALAITSLAFIGAPVYGHHRVDHVKGGGGGGEPTAYDIEVVNFAYIPTPFPSVDNPPMVVDMSPGSTETTVTWFDSQGNHDVTLALHDHDTGEVLEVVLFLDLRKGSSATVSLNQLLQDLTDSVYTTTDFTQPGLYMVHYHCEQHTAQNMEGMLRIEVQ